MCKICLKYSKNTSNIAAYAPTVDQLVEFTRNKKFRVKPGSVDVQPKIGNQRIFMLEEDVEVVHRRPYSMKTFKIYHKAACEEHIFQIDNVRIVGNDIHVLIEDGGHHILQHNGFILEVIE